MLNINKITPKITTNLLTNLSIFSEHPTSIQFLHSVSAQFSTTAKLLLIIALTLRLPIHICSQAVLSREQLARLDKNRRPPYRNQSLTQDTQAWQYLRNGKTKALTKLFQQQLITCNSVIVPASGHSIPHQAIVLDRREYFKLCEVYGANWDQQDKNGVTALMKAVALNRVYYVERLLELGADTEVKDHRGRDALWYGRFYQAWEAVDLLQESK